MKYTVVLTILSFRRIQYLHLMYAEVAWILVSSGTQVQLQTILNPGYLTNYFFFSYDYGDTPLPVLEKPPLLPTSPFLREYYECLLSGKISKTQHPPTFTEGRGGVPTMFTPSRGYLLNTLS